MQALRYCIVKGHETNIPKLICIAKDCNQQSRWVCEQCGIKLLHLHGYQTQDHLLEKQEIIELLNSRQSDLPLKELQNTMNKLTKIQQQLVDNLQTHSQSKIISIKQKLENDYYSVENDYIQQIIETIHQDRQQIKNKLLDYIKQIKDQVKLMEETLLKYQVQQIQPRIKIVQKIQTESQEDVKKQQQNNNQFTQYQLNQQDSQVQEERRVDYKKDHFVQYLQLKFDWSVKTAQISKDEKYLACGGDGKVVILYDLKQKQQLKQPLNLDKQISVCQFSKDSKLLYIGTQVGFVYCSDIENNLETIYSYQILHEPMMPISNIIEIINKVIIASSFGDICKIDIRYCEQIQKKLHNSRILALEFGCHTMQSKSSLISGSADLSIKFIDWSDLSILFEKQNAHSEEITYVQMTDFDQMMSLDFGHILKYGKQIMNKSKQVILDNQQMQALS